ncbi:MULTISPECIES: ABC transporter permease DevC [unclassified Leptolyngbya]|uniref:ABC transporter permease DevC n=1 Tax=unclassified Leptolyngbya TaxID=2650499 RepID=UPI0016890010|nr:MULTISPECIES: ABC transporter permease DevC [unclassified Leptolyngbya]MBD1912716.1 FtsX-like permease family protein [Leptolyngbya sp. FACHB-8]MBD2154661.1 FtsX-like permease family protein [Leptolyngbya sp. FACHB-16]
MLQTLTKKTPLAWLLLTKQKARLAVAIAGIAFADILMFVQMGFQGALFDAATKPYRELDADLVIANPQFQTLFAVRSTPRERLYQAAGVEGVESVSPLYIASAQWRNPETLQSRTILVWGFDPGSPVFQSTEINQNLDQIKPLNQVLFDRAGRPEYGAIAQTFTENGPFDAQLSNKQVQVSGVFTMGSSFAADGNVVVSDSTFLNLFPERTPDQIEVGLIRLVPGADVETVRQQIDAILPEDVMVLTPEGFADIEQGYWANGTGIGFIFGLGTIIGFIVGIVIVYQILYSDVSDHLPEFATLKAMGYSDRYLLMVLMQESLILALVGFVPSLLLATGLYQVVYAATLLPIGMKADRAIAVLLLTVIMCVASGAVAMRKLRSADPADIF